MKFGNFRGLGGQRSPKPDKSIFQVHLTMDVDVGELHPGTSGRHTVHVKNLTRNQPYDVAVTGQCVGGLLTYKHGFEWKPTGFHSGPESEHSPIAEEQVTLPQTVEADRLPTTGQVITKVIMTPVRPSGPPQPRQRHHTVRLIPKP